MDLVEKYSEKVQALIEEAKAEGITIGAYTREIRNGNGNFRVEEGISVILGDNYKDVPTWKR